MVVGNEEHFAIIFDRDVRKERFDSYASIRRIRSQFQLPVFRLSNGTLVQK